MRYNYATRLLVRDDPNRKLNLVTYTEANKLFKLDNSTYLGSSCVSLMSAAAAT